MLSEVLFPRFNSLTSFNEIPSMPGIYLCQLTETLLEKFINDQHRATWKELLSISTLFGIWAD